MIFTEPTSLSLKQVRQYCLESYKYQQNLLIYNRYIGFFFYNFFNIKGRLFKPLPGLVTLKQRFSLHQALPQPSLCACQKADFLDSRSLRQRRKLAYISLSSHGADVLQDSERKGLSSELSKI